MTDELDPTIGDAEKPAVPDPRPWPRYFARMLDTLILSMLMMIVLLFPAVFIAPEATDRLLLLLDKGMGGSILSNVIGEIGVRVDFFLRGGHVPPFAFLEEAELPSASGDRAAFLCWPLRACSARERRSRPKGERRRRE